MIIIATYSSQVIVNMCMFLTLEMVGKYVLIKSWLLKGCDHTVLQYLLIFLYFKSFSTLPFSNIEEINH